MTRLKTSAGRCKTFTGQQHTAIAKDENRIMLWSGGKRNLKSTTSSKQMIKSVLSAAALVGAAALSAAIPASAQASETQSEPVQVYAGVAASVNDEPITIADVSNRARLILLSLGVQPSEQTIVQAQQRALESLIDEKLQIQEAASWEVEVTDEEVEEDLSRLARSNGMSLDQFQNDLMRQGVNPSTLRQQLKADIAWQRLVGGRYGSRVRVSELQIDDKLKRLEKTLNEEQLHISEIFLPAYSDEQMAQMLQGAWSLRGQIEEGAPFGLVARQFSASPTAANGGDLGWMSLDQMKDELAEAVRALTPPAISEPVVTEDGVYLVALMERREPVDPVLSGFMLAQLEARGDVAEALLESAAETFTGCADIDEAADAVEGVEAVRLGALPVGQASVVYADIFTNTEEGALTPTLSFNDGRKAKVAVCERLMSGPQLPSRDEMEANLRDQQISLLADRYLRDLRREATILRR